MLNTARSRNGIVTSPHHLASQAGIVPDSAPVQVSASIMAGNVLMILPVVIMFIIFQKYFVQGMTMSGMKG